MSSGLIRSEPAIELNNRPRIGLGALRLPGTDSNAFVRAYRPASAAWGVRAVGMPLSG